MIGVKHVDSKIPAGRTRPLLAKSQVEGHGVISKNEILSRVEIENLPLVHGLPGKSPVSRLLTMLGEHCGLTVVAADERVLVVRFLAFQASRLRRGNTIVVGWENRSQLNLGVRRSK